MLNREEVSQELNRLNDLSRILMDCKTMEDVVKTSLEQVRCNLNTQVASIYLFTKNGTIKRIAIDGIDKNGNRIENSWLDIEEYQPGESFSGKSILPSQKESDYGCVHFSNNIQDDYHPVNRKQYKEKLGDLKSGISVPLNGLNGTFGTLEVLNKKNGEDFTENDISKLMLIGGLVSNFIFNFKRKQLQKAQQDDSIMELPMSL